MAEKGLPESFRVVPKRTQVATEDPRKSKPIWVCWRVFLWVFLGGTNHCH